MDVPPTKRHEKSLGLLTVKFVKLLKEAKDGILDLKEVRECVKLYKIVKHNLMFVIIFFLF